MAKMVECKKCEGFGTVECASCEDGSFNFLMGNGCDECAGDLIMKCPECEGKGKVEKEEK